MVFLNRISTLKDPQWDDIFDKALVFQAIIGKQRAKKEVIDLDVDGEVVESESDDDDLLDPRYDIIPQDVESY